MTNPMFDWPPVYLFDCSSFKSIHGCHGGCAPDNLKSAYSDEEQGLIWDCLASLAATERLKVVDQVLGELQHHCAVSHTRLAALKGHRTPARNDAVIRAYQELTGKHPRIVRRMSVDPGDPWIVAWARVMQMKGVRVITEETRLAEAKNKQSERRKLHNGPPLPDLCDDYLVRVTDLAGFVAAEVPDV